MPIYSNSHYRVEDVNTITPHKIDEADANTTYMCYLAISASAGEAAEIYGSSSLSGHRKQRIVRIKKVGNVTSYDQAIDVTWTGRASGTYSPVNGQNMAPPDLHSFGGHAG